MYEQTHHMPTHLLPQVLFLFQKSYQDSLHVCLDVYPNINYIWRKVWDWRFILLAFFSVSKFIQNTRKYFPKPWYYFPISICVVQNLLNPFNFILLSVSIIPTKPTIFMCSFRVYHFIIINKSIEFSMILISLGITTDWIMSVAFL